MPVDDSGSGVQMTPPFQVRRSNSLLQKSVEQNVFAAVSVNIERAFAHCIAGPCKILWPPYLAQPSGTGAVRKLQLYRLAVGLDSSQR